MGIPAGARPVFRLTGGVALASTVTFSLALPMSSLFILFTAMFLATPAPPPGIRGSTILIGIALVVTLWGALLGPVLINAPTAGILIILSGIGMAVWLGFRPGMAIIRALLILSHAIIAVVASQSSAAAIEVVKLCLGSIAMAIVIAHFMHVLLPNLSAPPRPPTVFVEAHHARWVGVRTALVMTGPVLMAMSNPATYIVLLMKGSTLAAQVEEGETRRLGVETVTSTLVGSAAALTIWWLLKVWAELPTLVLLLTLSTLLIARRMYRHAASRFPPSFWLNALITLVILIGAAVTDIESGANIQQKMIVRSAMFAALSLYAVLAVKTLDALRPRTGINEVTS
jgi:hypothetical protein